MCLVKHTQAKCIREDVQRRVSEVMSLLVVELSPPLGSRSVLLAIKGINDHQSSSLVSPAAASPPLSLSIHSLTTHSFPMEGSLLLLLPHSSPSTRSSLKIKLYLFLSSLLLLFLSDHPCITLSACSF
uniref:Uncharacterized protein n=1 Tax=Anguilla anguilla TaxID=7936 RepID=A0A0E9X8B7_ANGAN